MIETKCNAPIISVVIPVYNGADKISKCLTNLDNQTISEPYEVIIVDDASPDNSGFKIKEMIMSLEHSDRFKVIICERNGRAGKARNIGVKNALGEYVVFVDQDDYPDTDMLNVLYSLIDNGNYDCSSCDISDKGGNVYHRHSCILKKSLSVSEKIEIMSRFGYVFAIMIRKKTIIDNQLFFPENLLFEDSLYTYGLISVINSMNNTNKILYYRNYNDEAQTANITKKKLVDRVQSTETYIKCYKNNNNITPYMNIIKQYAFYYIFLSCTWWMITLKDVYDKEFFLSCYKKARELNVSWNDVSKSQCYFGKKKNMVLRIIYYLPWMLPLFRAIYCKFKL